MEFSQKQKIILNILADGRFHSGTSLSKVLHVSRSAVWKHLHALSELGIKFEAVRGKGYRLNQAIELLDQPRIDSKLTAQVKALINSLEVHDQIESTNSYLVRRAYQGEVSGQVCLAEYQTAGKGRRGNQWVSPFGSNIYLSLLWRFQNGPAAISGLSLAAGVAVIRALKKHNITGIGLKWPNDIYWQGKKLGGILVEVSGETEGPCFAVIGLGLNIFLPVKEAEVITQDWVDLSQIIDVNNTFRNDLHASMLNELLPVIAQFENRQIASYLDEWRNYDCMKGKSATLYMANQQYQGVVQGVDDNGMLILKHANGEIQVFASGEVSFNARP